MDQDDDYAITFITPRNRKYDVNEGRKALF